MKSFIYVLAIVVIILACSKKEEPAIANEIIFVQPSTTNTIMVTPGEKIDFEVKLSAQNKVNIFEGHSTIGRQGPTLFLNKEFTSENNSEVYSGSYTVPLDAPNFTTGELVFRLYDKTASSTPVKVSKLAIMVH